MRTTLLRSTPWLLAGMATLALTAAPAAQRPTNTASVDGRAAAHVLNRLAFGPRPGDVERVQAMGVKAYIEQQLHPEGIPDERLEGRLQTFATLTMSQSDLQREYFAPAQMAQQQRRQLAAQNPARGATPPAQPAMMPEGDPAGAPRMQPQAAAPAQADLTPEERQAQQLQRAAMSEATESRMLRAALSERQLQEVLTDFWFNHFNVFIGKGQVREYLMVYERDAIRPFVFGKFRDMLGAVAHSPAMLFYLDNFQSAAPNASPLTPQQQQRLNDPRLSPQQRQRLADQIAQRMAQAPQRPVRGLNENYARELMELHTLGVDGGYTQKDVIDLARILTGWTIDQPRNGGQFVFRPQLHDAGEKTLLGVTFKSDGEREGERALDLLASQPATAHHIAFKLAQRLIADEPPASVVDRAAKTFLSTKGDLREVVRTIVTSPEFSAPAAYRAKVKTPFEFVVSAVRATGATIASGQPLVAALQNLGMPLYGCQPPTGYSMTADAWVNTGALLNRMNFAVQLLDGGRVPPPQNGRGADAGPQGPPPPQGPNGAARPNAAARPGGAGPGRQGGRGAQSVRPLSVDVRALAPDTGDAARAHVVQQLLASDVSEATQKTLARAETPQNLIALALGSPEFQRR